MFTQRKKGIPIHTGRRVVNDDRPPAIDPYGLAMIESLAGGLQTLLLEDHAPEINQRLEQLTAYAEALADRYSE